MRNPGPPLIRCDNLALRLDGWIEFAGALIFKNLADEA